MLMNRNYSAWKESDPYGKATDFTEAYPLKSEKHEEVHHQNLLLSFIIIDFDQ